MGVNDAFVEITRGPIVESAHAIWACAVDRTGTPIVQMGDIETPVYLRSSAKPFIAAAAVRAGVVQRFGLEPREVAVMAASHSGEPFHIDAVRSILRKIGLPESALQCGPHPPYNAAAAKELADRGEPFTAIHNNCSGKHAGILALCVLLNCDPATYMQPANPAEQEILAFCARMTGDTVADFPIGVDGCGIPVFAVPALHGARAFMRLATLEGIDAEDARALGAVREAMLDYPLYIAGTDEFDSVLMAQSNRTIACKGGAEAVHGDAVISEGIGLFVKVRDGGRRAVAPTVLAILDELEAIALNSASGVGGFRGAADSKSRRANRRGNPREAGDDYEDAKTVSTMPSYLDLLRERIVLFDGAMGTQVMALEPEAARFGGAQYHGCNEALVLSEPQLIERIHAGYFEAGADIVETDTFTGSRLKLDEYGLGERTAEINRRAAEIARSAAERFSTPDWPRFVAGSLGPTGMLISSSDPLLSRITYDQLVELYREQAVNLLAGGVDLLVIETMQDLLEAKAAIAGIQQAFESGSRRVPVQAQVTLDVTGRMLLGTDIRAVCATLDALPIDVIGLNCSTGPLHMRDPVRYLCEASTKFISVIPNAGLPKMGPQGETIYPETPDELAHELKSFVQDFGVNVVGGCCGTTPDHIAALRDAIRGVKPRMPTRKTHQFVASAMTAVALEQEPRPLLVGERINAQGSRRTKRLLLEEKYDDIMLVAREQVEGGAHVLDICCAMTERTDEDAQMQTLVKKLAQSTEAPLMIDSTEPRVLETALKNYGGRAIVNSVHLENGRVKIDTIMPLVMETGAAVVALTIDEQGMAKTAERKTEIAGLIYDICVREYGLPPGALIFDALTFTLATGAEEYIDSAIQTIEGIRKIKAQLPGVLASLGVSNVSFGLKPHARATLNSVFLHHCVEAGLGYRARQREGDHALRRDPRRRAKPLRRPRLQSPTRCAAALHRALGEQIGPGRRRTSRGD